MRFDFTAKVAVVTGGGGAICGAIASALAAHGSTVAVWDISADASHRRAREISDAGGQSLAIECDVTDRDQVVAATKAVLAGCGTIDFLVNGAGGSCRDATTSDDLPFFDIAPDGLEEGLRLNYLSAVLCSQAVGRVMAKKEEGAVVNISSIAGLCPLSRAIAYSSAKAAVNNFTHWLAVHMARDYSPRIRVNAIAPGFILTDQNRFLLEDEATGETTERGRQIIRSVPMGRYGLPEEIVGAALWLLSDQASFVTGAVVPVDGGFTACSGV